jgi:hypothetical protein
MSKERDLIAEFIRQMRERHEGEIEGVQFPEGTREYVLERVRAGDADTLLFMLKLGYLMGLQTGFAARQAGEASPPRGSPWGPLEA